MPSIVEPCIADEEGFVNMRIPWNEPKGSASELQARRMLADQLLLEGSDVSFATHPMHGMSSIRWASGSVQHLATVLPKAQSATLRFS